MSTTAPTNNLVDTSDHSQHRDVGALAAWSVSSSKPGYGVEQLIQSSLDTLWQSVSSLSLLSRVGSFDDGWESAEAKDRNRILSTSISAKE